MALSTIALVSTICQDMLVPQWSMEKGNEDKSQSLFSISLRIWGKGWRVNKELQWGTMGKTESEQTAVWIQSVMALQQS